MGILSNIGVGLLVLMLLGICIFVHELGHFLAARWCGMVIDTFSIGMGPAIWKRKRNGITYRIGWIPFGGYVALPQLDPTGMALIQGEPEAGASDKPSVTSDQAKKEKSRELPRIAPWKKIVVSLAGGVGNLILAVIIAWLVFWLGKPATIAETSSMVGYVEEGSAAWNQGCFALVWFSTRSMMIFMLRL